MKSTHLRIMLALVGAAGLCDATFAQYSIDWHTLDGGGGTRTGGFWALLIAIQFGGASALTIAPATPSNATISWSPNTPWFVLQETLSLSSTHWLNSDRGSTNPIVVPATLPA